MKAIVIKATGEKQVVEFVFGDSYDTISEGVGGWIECVSLPSKGVEMWVNEEGKLNGLAQNAIATALWVDDYDLTDVIVGDVVITGVADDEGETTGLNDLEVEAFLAYNSQMFVF